MLGALEALGALKAGKVAVVFLTRYLLLFSSLSSLVNLLLKLLTDQRGPRLFLVLIRQVYHYLP